MCHRQGAFFDNPFLIENRGTRLVPVSADAATASRAVTHFSRMTNEVSSSSDFQDRRFMIDLSVIW